MTLIFIKVLLEARLQWRRAIMKPRIELRTHLECGCHELFEGLRMRPCAAKKESAHFTEHGLLAMCSMHPKRSDGFFSLSVPPFSKNCRCPPFCTSFSYLKTRCTGRCAGAKSS